MPYSNNFGEAYLLYDIYVREVEKLNQKPVSFVKFLIGKR